jgi:hypothetical protein
VKAKLKLFGRDLWQLNFSGISAKEVFELIIGADPGSAAAGAAVSDEKGRLAAELKKQSEMT